MPVHSRRRTGAPGPTFEAHHDPLHSPPAYPPFQLTGRARARRLARKHVRRGAGAIGPRARARAPCRRVGHPPAAAAPRPAVPSAARPPPRQRGAATGPPAHGRRAEHQRARFLARPRGGSLRRSQRPAAQPPAAQPAGTATIFLSAGRRVDAQPRTSLLRRRKGAGRATRATRATAGARFGLVAGRSRQGRIRHSPALCCSGSQ